MKNTAFRIIPLAVATLLLSGCGTISNLIATPPADLTGKYADTSLVLEDVCGAHRDAEFHLSVDTMIAEDDTSLHQFSANVIIFGAGEDGSAITTSAEWSVPGTNKAYNSGFVEGLGTITLASSEEGFAGTATLHDVTCVTQNEGGEEVTTHERVTFNFKAEEQ